MYRIPLDTNGFIIHAVHYWSIAVFGWGFSLQENYKISVLGFLEESDINGHDEVPGFFRLMD